MKKWIFLTALIPALSFGQVTTLDIKAQCAKTETVARMITEYQEQLIWSNADKTKGNVTSLWVNKTTGSYSVVITTSSGEITCLVVSGKGIKD